MKACTYCGKENTDDATHCWECGTDLPLPANPPPPRRVANAAPRLLTHTLASSMFYFADGFHRVDWEPIAQWIQHEIAAHEQEEAWNEAVFHWVNQLRDDLGGDYAVHSSSQFYLLTDLPEPTAQWLLDYAGNCEDTIRAELRHVAWGGSRSKGLLLLFSETDDYYQYVSFHCREGVQAQSGGMCIHAGYSHIALPWHDEAEAASAVAHELTHDCLAHLPLPLWLNEGLAMTLEQAIAPPRPYLGQSARERFDIAMTNWSPPLMWDELAERHFAFWNERNIQAFWAGTSFYEAGDSNELSYSLAQVLVKLLSEGNGPFLDFVVHATSLDAGQTAALDVLGVDLADVAGTFLGQGNWRPRRAAIAEHWKLAGWTEQR